MNARVDWSRVSVTLRTAWSRRIGLLIPSAHACKKSDGKNLHKWAVRHASFSCAPKIARRVVQRQRNADVPLELSSATQWTDVLTKHAITWIVKYATRTGAGFVVVIQATNLHARTPNISSRKQKSFSKTLRSKFNQWKRNFSNIRGVSFGLTLRKILQQFSRWMKP